MTDDEIAAKASDLLAQAEELPTPEQIMNLAAQAEAHGDADMSAADIRELAEQAVEAAETVTALLRRIAMKLAAPPRDSDRGDM